MTKTITFENDRAFVKPTARNKAAFTDLLTRIGIGGTQNRLLITGHTDSAGGGTAAGITRNQELSERRTEAVEAVLLGKVSTWEDLFTRDSWGDPELQEMATEVGEPDISRFRGPANAANRATLFTTYFGRLLSGATVPPLTTTTPARLGCGQKHLLRGSRTSFSKNPALPPITGKFEENRRAEFFFFDSFPSVIDCSEYPTWTAPCSLTPPPPPAVTVTIAALDTVRVGATVDVVVTITPSPLRFGTQVSLKLSTTNGTGEAKFASNNSDTLTVTASGPVTIRGVTASSGVDNIRLTATVAGQTTVLAQEDFMVTEAIVIFLQFEVFNLKTKVFEPLPAGVDIDLDRDLGSSGRAIATRQTAAGGRVFFSLPDLNASGVPNPDVFFLAHTNALSHANHTIPVDWSTKGWLAADNTTPGLQRAFTGPQLGTASSPIVFRIGVDFHGQLKYHADDGGRAGKDDPAPPNIPVQLKQERKLLDVELLSFLTGPDGEFHGVSFEAEPGKIFYLHVDFKMSDSAVNLEGTRVTNAALLTLSWDSKDAGPDRTVAPHTDRTSIGTQTAPLEFLARAERRNVALYQLKVLRELAVFLFEISDHKLSGIPVRVTPVAPFGSFSFPLGQVNISTGSEWSRSTILHEMSHQLMWRDANISKEEIATLAGSQILHGCHDTLFLSNRIHALIEGWAEFVAAIFEGGPVLTATTVLENFGPIIDPSDPRFPSLCGGTPITKPVTVRLGPGGGEPNNQGESVEGAFTSGLLSAFDNHVVGAVSASRRIPERAKEQILVDAPWVKDKGVHKRFRETILNPFNSLQDIILIINKNTTEMIAAMRRLNPTTWHLIQPELQRFNMAMTVPTVTGVSPKIGPPAGGTRITITGTEFTSGTTTVTVGGNPATSVNVTVPPGASAPVITCDTPAGLLGPAGIVVTTPAGTAPLSGFTYVPAPLVKKLVLTNDPSNPNPNGLTTGGTPVTITGADFDPRARVFFGGLPGTGEEATDVVPLSANEITAKTPLFPLPKHQPGGTDVFVLNPDGLSGSLSKAFDYVLGPAPQTTRMQPDTGSAAGGVTVVIIGANFDRDGVKVFIDQKEADLVQASTTQITLLTPKRPGTTTSTFVDVLVRNPDGQTATGQFIYQP